jgi:hypothetical protein
MNVFACTFSTSRPRPELEELIFNLPIPVPVLLPYRVGLEKEMAFSANDSPNFPIKITMAFFWFPDVLKLALCDFSRVQLEELNSYD